MLSATTVVAVHRLVVRGEPLEVLVDGGVVLSAPFQTPMEACVRRPKIDADHVYHQAVMIAHDVPPLRMSSLTRDMEPAKKREQYCVLRRLKFEMVFFPEGEPPVTPQ